MSEHTQQVALVTGASRGIGAAIAQELGGEAIALPALAALLDTVTGLAERADAITLRQVLAALAEVTEPPRPDPRLREMDFGCWEMQPWQGIPREAVDAWTADFARHRFGGRESAQEVIDRCCALADANPILSIHDVGAGGLSTRIE